MYILPKELPKGIENTRRTRLYDYVGTWRREDTPSQLFWHYKEVKQALHAGDCDYRRTLAQAPDLFDVHAGRVSQKWINDVRITKAIAKDRLSFLYSWQLERVAYVNFLEYCKTVIQV